MFNPSDDIIFSVYALCRLCQAVGLHTPGKYCQVQEIISICKQCEQIGHCGTIEQCPKSKEIKPLVVGLLGGQQ